MYTLIHKSYYGNKRILNLVRKLKILELKAARIKENFFNMNVNEFKKFRKPG